VLQSRRSIEYQSGTAAIVPIVVGVDERTSEVGSPRRRFAAEGAIDEVLADSFPASDPPSWNPGVVRPDPVIGTAGDELRFPDPRRADAVEREASADRPGEVANATATNRTFFQGLASLAAVAGIAVLVPIAILLVGFPVALVIRGLLEAIGLLFGVDLR
jgi:hypothetical protein